VVDPVDLYVPLVSGGPLGPPIRLDVLHADGMSLVVQIDPTTAVGRSNGYQAPVTSL
jgi:hypothetical protein